MIVPPGRLVLALALLLAGLGCETGGRRGSPRDESWRRWNPRSSVVLVSIDTLRADRLAPDGPMPHLAELAQEGLQFERAHTPVPLTLPAHTTLLSGLDPPRHGVRDNIGYALDRSIPTVAELFAAAGYRTAAFVGGYPLSRSFGLQRGFETYDDRLTRSSDPRRSGPTERRAEEVIGAALAWLRAEPREPFFLWIHLFDPHDPYDPPPGFQGRHATPYDDEVAYADAALASLVAEVRRSTAGAPWWVVTADHGESLGEHGESTHGIFLYESTLRVPLVVVPPVRLRVGRSLQPVSLADVAPTLLDAAGIRGLEQADGRSFLDLFAEEPPAGGPSRGRPLYIESIHGRRRYGWAPLYGFIDWPTKYIQAPLPELYDLQQDPAELHPSAIADDEPLAEKLGRVRGALRELDPGHEISVDLERMAALGYIGGSGANIDPAAIDDRPRPDPKDRIGALAALERGLQLMAEGRSAQARPELEQALLADPDNLVTLNNLGILALRTGDPVAAERFFTEGLRRDRQAENLANNLGMALSRQGRAAEAAGWFAHALKARPGFLAARFNLALALHRQGHHSRALEELERVRQANPEFPDLEPTLQTVRASLR